jgi:hypothetical protein
MIQPLLSSALAIPPHDGFVWSGPWRIARKGNPDSARSRLEEALKMVDPSILQAIERSKEEETKECICFAETSDASRADGDHLDVVAFIGQIAVQNDLFDIAAACIRAVTEHKTASPVSAVLLEIARAELHVRAFSMVDAHVQSGYFDEAPVPFLQTMASLAASQHGDKPVPDRRASYALALSSSVVNVRTSDGRIVLLPHGMPAATTAVPALTPAEVQELALARRSEAVRTLKTALSNAERLASSFLTEYAASVAWNMCMPLLEHSVEHQHVCLATLSAAASGLELCDSINYALRAVRAAFAFIITFALVSHRRNAMQRLHATLAQLLAKADMVTSASEHLTKLAKLDYGSSAAGSEWLSRPLDDAAEVLRMDAALLQSLHADFEHPSDRVYHILTQAQHALESVVRDSLVVKAVELLDAIEDADTAGYFPEAWQKLTAPSYAQASFLDVKASPPASQEVQIAADRIKTRRHLRQWLLLAEVAARGQHQSVALHAADMVRKQQVILPQDRDVALLQCRADVLNAECYAAMCVSYPCKSDADDITYTAAARNANYRRHVIHRAASGAASQAAPGIDVKWWTGELESDSAEAAAESATLMENWERGSAPGQKPIYHDVRLLGLHIPGCPVPMLRMKVLVITSLVQAVHRGMQLELRTVVESAGKRIWNMHLHIWDANEYGPAVFPVLMDAVLECVRCLVACGSAEGALIAKMTLVCARYHEELGRAQQLQDRLAIPCGAAIDVLDGAVLLEHTTVVENTVTGSIAGLQGLHDECLDGSLAQALWRPPQQASLHMRRALVLVSSVLAHCSGQLPALCRLQLISCRHRVRTCLLFGTDVTAYGRVQTPVASADQAGKKVAGGSLVDLVAKIDDPENDWSSVLPALFRVTGALQTAIHPAGEYTERVSALQNAAANIANMLKEQAEPGSGSKNSQDAASPAGSKPSPAPKKESLKPSAKSAPGATTAADFDALSAFRVGWEGLLTTDALWQNSTQLLTAAGDTAAVTKARQHESRMHNIAICCGLWSRMGAVAAQLSATWAPTPDAAVAVFAQRLCANAVSLFPGAPVPQDDLTGLKDLPGHTRDLYQFPLPSGSNTASWEQKFYHTAFGGAVDGIGYGGFVNICNSLWLAHVYWAASICVLVSPQFQTPEEIARLLCAAADHLVHSGTFAARIQDRHLLQQSANHLLELATKLPAVHHHQALGRWVSTLISAFETLSAKSPSSFPILARMFALNLHCLGLSSDWNTGLQVTSKAFAQLPPAFHDLLWKSRLLFESKLGKDVTLSLSGMRQKDPLLRAKLWLSIARMSSAYIDQSHAYTAALQAVQGGFAKVFVQVEVAEWLLNTGSTCQAVKDMLLDAAASILIVENPSNSEAEENATDGLSVARSASARSHSHSARSRGTVNRTGGDKAGKMKEVVAEGWPNRREISHLDCALRIMQLLAVVSSSGQESASFLQILSRFAHQMLQLNCHTLNASVAERTYFKMSDAQRAACGNYDSWIIDQQHVGEFRVPHTADNWTPWLQQMAIEPKFWEGPVAAAGKQACYGPNTQMLNKMVYLSSEVTAAYQPYVISAKSVRNPVALFLLLEEALALLSGMNMWLEQSTVLTLLYVVSQLEPCASSPTCQTSMRCHVVDWATRMKVQCHASWNSQLHSSIPLCLHEAGEYARLAGVFTGELGGELPRSYFGMERRIIAIIECYHKLGIHGAVAPLSQFLRRMPALVGAAHVILVADIVEARTALAQGVSINACEALIKATLQRIAAGCRWTELFACLADALVESNQLRDANSMLLLAIAAADRVLAARTTFQKPCLDVYVMCIRLRCLLLDVASKSVLSFRQLGMPWREDWDRLLAHGERAIQLARTCQAGYLETDATAALVNAHWHCLLGPMAWCPRDEELLRVEAMKPELQPKCCWLTLQAAARSTLQLPIPVNFGRQALQTLLLSGYARESETAARLAGDPVATYLYSTDLEISRMQNGTSCSDVRSLMRMLHQLSKLTGSPHEQVISAAIVASCQFTEMLFEAAEGKDSLFPFIKLRERWSQIMWSDIVTKPAGEITDRIEVPDSAAAKSAKAADKKPVARTEKEKSKPPKGKADAGTATSLDLAAEFMRLPAAATDHSSMLLSANSGLYKRITHSFSLLVRQEIIHCNQEVISAASTGLQSCVTTYDLGSAATLAETLVEAYGTLQPVRAALALAQMQSLNSMHYLRDLWAAAEQASGKPALHMKLYTDLLKMHRERAVDSSSFQDTLNFLQQESLPFRLTDWRRPLGQVLKCLPFGHRAVIFEMSADLQCLYVGVVWRAAPADSENQSKSPFEGTDVAHRDLPGIFGFVAAKQLSLSERHGLCALVNASDDLYKDSWSAVRHMHAVSTEADLANDAQASLDVAEASLSSIVSNMNILFSQLMTRPEGAVSISAAIKDFPVIICANRWLASLPLEGLSSLQHATSLDREFSLHFLANRSILGEVRTTSDPAESTPKVAFGAPAPDVVPANLSLLQYLADPFGDEGMGEHTSVALLHGLAAIGSAAPETKSKDKEGGKQSRPVSAAYPSDKDSETTSLVSLMTAGQVAPSVGGMTAGWQGIAGDQGIPSQSAIRSLLRSFALKPSLRPEHPSLCGGVLVFYGHGRLVHAVSPALLCSTSAPACRLALILDSITDESSARRIATSTQRSSHDSGRSFENSFDTAALLSLTGIGSVVLHQWASSPAVNKALLYGFMERCNRNGSINVAACLRSLVGKGGAETSEGPANGLKQRVRLNTVVYGVPTDIISS